MPPEPTMSERELDDSTHKEKVPAERPAMLEDSPRRSRRGRRRGDGLGLSPSDHDEDTLSADNVTKNIKKLSLDDSESNEDEEGDKIGEEPSGPRPELRRPGKRSGRSRRVVERHPTGDESDLIALAQMAQKAKQMDAAK